MIQEKSRASLSQPLGLTYGNIVLILLNVLLIIGFVPYYWGIRCKRGSANIICAPIAMETSPLTFKPTHESPATYPPTLTALAISELSETTPVPTGGSISDTIKLPCVTTNTTVTIEPKLFDLRRREIGALGSGESISYSFITDREPIMLVLLFKPQVNHFNRQFDFAIVRGGQRIDCASDYRQIPEDDIYGGLVWQGGRLGESYSLIISNASSRTVEFCLAPKQVSGWVECLQ